MFNAGEAHPMHEADFIQFLRGNFICSIPEDGRMSLKFLDDLIEDVGNKSGFYSLLINHIYEIYPALINSPETLKAKTKDQHIVRMKMIHTYLKNEKYIDCAENDFLYWFGLNELPKPPAKINWLKADSILKNVIHQICDTSGEQYINRAFKFNKHYVTTNYKTDYVGSNLFKKIEGYLFHAVTKI